MLKLAPLWFFLLALALGASAKAADRMVGSEWSEDHRSPKSIGGKNTQSLHVQVDTDVDAHCERARAAGAEILMEPAMQFYGAKTYRCRDPEGHIWTVAQTVREVSREEAEAVSGLKITGWI